MKTFGLIGYPLAQSFSYKYFTSKFKNENIDARFLNFEIPTIEEFPSLIDHHPYIAGLSVTIPYKEKVIQYLNELDVTAEKVGAVNSIKITWKDKKPYFKGYNTDLIGFKNSILPFIKDHHKKALVLGTGGAAKAVAHALEMLGLEYKYVSRKEDTDNLINYSSLTPDILDEYKVIVNSTPVGMYPNIDECPDIDYNCIGKNHLLFDLTYNPENTKFMQMGAKNGAATKNGLEMLHLQAEASWAIWNDL
ncbi:shikimate dehydrogenase family protein [Carboxylicivirga caseinilyticus]|uniref:shikimate dehydrogenase family protein n=1 Tax=Carboxylicivirga caseinilyticus TaxID=3417572 RepID=UPI003D34690C|nr:shikimate dehydrogenase [Marinilabiliaceae bacterium A049]